MPQRSREIVAISGWSRSHSEKLSAARSGSRSTTRCASRLTRIVPYSWPLRQAQSSTPKFCTGRAHASEGFSRTRRVEQCHHSSRWTNDPEVAGPDGRQPHNQSAERSRRPAPFAGRTRALSEAVVHKRSSANTLDFDSDTGRRWPTTVRTHLAMADPEDDGSSNCAAIAMIRRKAGRRAPAQRAPPNGIGQHRVPRDPRSECQGLVEGIANGSGEVPSLPKHKTIQADSVLDLGCIKIAEEPSLGPLRRFNLAHPQSLIL